ncbi:uncharacterized protein LOC125237646 [Leguminivora glycinivorella]|uniref:uncharacterized protein LOC125237646 n=1 Tax=Leguminivora glycinivorella TaxID=1035111 RepID=UPI00200D5E5D|nr:uncharacterized protein LOC125237646 [Leguminivora glycinivorella]
MNEPISSNAPEPKIVGVWTEGARIEPKEFIIPKNSPESSDDIPTIPDLDDLQDILEKEIAKPPPTDHKDRETVNTLAAVGDGYSGSADGVEAALAALRARVPTVQSASDTVWTIDSLLAQLAEEGTDQE